MKKLILILFLIVTSFSLGITITESKLNSILKDFKNPKIDAIQKYSDEIFSRSSAEILRKEVIYQNFNSAIVLPEVKKPMKNHFIESEIDEKIFKELLIKNSHLNLDMNFFICNSKDIDLTFKNIKLICLYFFASDTKNTVKVYVNEHTLFSFLVNEKVKVDVTKIKKENNVLIGYGVCIPTSLLKY